jgi:hypothetical protein
MHMRAGLVAGATAMVFAVAGCGQQAVTPARDSAFTVPAATGDLPVPGLPVPGLPVPEPSPWAGATVTPGPAASVTPAPAPAEPQASPAASPDAGCTSIGVMLTNSDNGKTLCVYEGTDVVVMLAGDSGGIRATGPLTPRPDLVPALEPGVTGAAFVASQPGVARVLSVLAPCGSGPGMHCMLLMLYHVTINVVAPAS